MSPRTTLDRRQTGTEEQRRAGMGAGMKARAIFLLILLVGACDHTAPFDVQDPEPLGPFGHDLPIQLTFNVGEDWHPSANTDFIVYSRLEASRSDSDRCMAALPVGGGTLSGVFCAGGSYADSMVDAWIEPAPSPDGRIAYVRDRGRPFGFGPSTRRLAVTPLEDPDDILFELAVPIWLDDGRRVTAIQQISWSSQDVLRFLAGEDVYTVDPPALPDTSFVPFRVVELNLETGLVREFGATEGTPAFTAAPDGGVWFVLGSELLHLAPDSDTALSVGFFSAPAISVAPVGPRPVAVVLKTLVAPDGSVSTWTEVEWLDLATGGPAGSLLPPGLAGRIAGVPGTRHLVAEVSSGGKTNLWLLQVP